MAVFTIIRRICYILLTSFLFFTLSVYFVYFQRPATEEILAANVRSRDIRSLNVNNSVRVVAVGDYFYYDEEDLTKAQMASINWEDWTIRNNLVSIGDTFNTCDGPDKYMNGQLVLLPDKQNGGVKSQAHINLTLDHEVVSGTVYLTSWYNGQHIYQNNWDLCTVEQGWPDPVLTCPLQPGKTAYVKHMKVANYLPKGRYVTKAWIADQHNNTFLCVFTEFTL